MDDIQQIICTDFDKVYGISWKDMAYQEAKNDGKLIVLMILAVFSLPEDELSTFNFFRFFVKTYLYFEKKNVNLKVELLIYQSGIDDFYRVLIFEHFFTLNSILNHRKYMVYYANLLNSVYDYFRHKLKHNNWWSLDL